MTAFEMMLIVFAASLIITLLAWLRYALYGGAFKSNLILAIGSGVLSFIIIISACAAFVQAYGWAAFWLAFGTITIPTVSSWFFVTRNDQ